LARRDPQIAKVLDRFVTVRVVQAWGMDLSLFQFDGDLTWSIFFLNADRTIYGRYSTRSARDAAADVSLDGIKKAAEAALELHENYPRNKEALAAKKGPEPKWATPEKIPNIPGQVMRADGTRGGCIHCHTIPQGQILTLHKAGQPVEDRLFYAYPKPDVLGLVLDPKERATVKTVTAGSAAEKAGFQAGDELLRLEGQPLISVADVQWVLQNANEPAKLKAEVRREGKTVEVTLPLAEGWRHANDVSWRQSMWTLRVQVAGMRCAPVPADKRKDLGLAADAFALKVEYFPADGAKDRNPGPVKAGVQLGDVLVEVDGKTTFANEGDFLGYLVQKKKPGDTVKLTVLRGKERKEFDVPVQ
jgi:hypothetical protein